MTRSFWGWPGSAHLTRFSLLAGMVAVWWVLLYGGANLITTLHPYRVRLHIDAELAMPFVPAGVLVYLSIYLIFAMIPFVLRTNDELCRLAGALAAAIAVASVIFVVCPGDPHFETPVDAGVWAPLVTFARWLALKHNFFPSLHVALSSACLWIMARQAPGWGKLLLAGWGVAIGLSTLLLHQHYLIDVLAGLVLGLASVKLVYDRLPAVADDAASGVPANRSSHQEQLA